jgi:hypothetical protein
VKPIARLSLALAALALVSAASAVQAQQLPLPLARRPLTLTRNTLRADADLTLAHLQISLLGGTGSSNALGLSLGAGYGITDDLEVGATVIPLTLSPDFAYNAPSVYGTYRFLHGDVDVGAQLALTLPIDRDFGLGVGVPVLFHLGEAARLDTGAFLGLTFGDALGKGLTIPIAFTYNLNPNLFLGARTGVLLPNFDDFAMPLGAFVGYTLAGGAGNTPLADITASFDFPFFVTPSGADAISTGLWTASLNGRIFFNL